jgi:hypothetical protein
VADARNTIHQIEYRWDDRRDLSPVASSMSQESLRAWDTWIRGWVRHPHADRLSESLCYQIQRNGRAALAWRYEWESAEREDGTRGRPLVSRVLVGMADLLTPEVAIVLCHAGLPATAGPRAGQVPAKAGLPVISSAELSALARDRAAELDKEAARQEGLRQVIAAALANPPVPLAISIRDPHILKVPEEGLQWRLLWGLRRIVWPVLRTTGRGWSFSTFELPLGEGDPATLPDILFRQAQDAPTAGPARPRPEIKIRPLDPAAPEADSLYTEMAGLLVDEYKERGGEELKQLIAGWSSGEQSLDRHLYRVYDELRARQSPITVSESPGHFVSLLPDQVPPRGPALQPALTESCESAPAEPIESAPPERSLPEDEAAPLYTAPSPPDEYDLVAKGPTLAAAEGDPGAQGPVPDDQIAVGSDPDGCQGGLGLQSPAPAGDEAVAGRQTTAPDEDLRMPVITPDQQAHEQRTETGRDPAQDSERERSGLRNRPGEQEPELSGTTESAGAIPYLAAGQHVDVDTAPEHRADHRDPGAAEYPAGPGDLADPEDGGGFANPSTPASPPHPSTPAQPAIPSQPVKQSPVPPGQPPLSWAQRGDDLLGPGPKEASPPPQWGQNQQRPSGREPQLPVPQAGTVDQLLKMLPKAANEREFWIIHLRILGLGIPSEQDRVRARREVSKPGWYEQILSRFGDSFGIMSLSEIFEQIVLPDLNNSLVADMIAQWAVEKNPVMIGGLLTAASRTDDDIWQSMMAILQPHLAYRWTVENLRDTLWNPAIAPQPDDGPGRGRRGRRRRK